MILAIQIPLAWLWRLYVAGELLSDEGESPTEGVGRLFMDWARQQLELPPGDYPAPTGRTAPPTPQQMPYSAPQPRGPEEIVGTPEWLEEMEAREQWGYRAPRRPKPVTYCGTCHHHNY